MLSAGTAKMLKPGSADQPLLGEHAAPRLEHLIRKGWRGIASGGPSRAHPNGICIERPTSRIWVPSTRPVRSPRGGGKPRRETSRRLAEPLLARRVERRQRSGPSWPAAVFRALKCGCGSVGGCGIGGLQRSIVKQRAFQVAGPAVGSARSTVQLVLAGARRRAGLGRGAASGDLADTGVPAR